MPPTPANEAARLAALVELQILDTDIEPAYEGLVQLASIVCGAESASLTMIDRDRQWHKAMHNVASREAPREITFCAHTICEEDGIMVVEDTSADVRFHDNPLVVGAPHIGFYAGHTLQAPGGEAVGTICVLDNRPRRMSDTQRVALAALARQADVLLELRLKARELAREAHSRQAAEGRANIARDLAEAANRAKSEFLARMSHELRTPLNSIIGFSRTLTRRASGDALTDRDRQYLSRIEANGHHLLEVINDILDLARVESGQMPVERASGSLAELVRDIVSTLQGKVLASDGSSRIALVGDVPDGLADIETDWMRLKQVLINLVGNALKFTERGSVTVRVVAEGDGRRPARIDVIDTGIGIPANRQAAIFKAFEQVSDDTARKYGGSGLGLAITQGIADMLGYRITVASEPGAGATFSVHLC